MTVQNKASLQALFETGDVPSGANFSDFIDSCVNMAETGTQAMAGTLNPTELVTPRVSATNVNITGILSANTVSFTSFTANTLNVTGAIAAASISVTGTVSAATLNTTTLITNTLNATGAVSAASLNVTGDVSAATGTIYASAMRSTNGVFESVGIVSAAGTAQTTGAPLTFIINRGAGVVDGQTTGFVIPANRTGLTQVIVNGAASANLWPPTGGAINALAGNAAFPMVASTPYIIYHVAASSYAVK